MDTPTTDSVRTYLVVVDATPESAVALRYASLRAARVGARVSLLHVTAVEEFQQWGGVQAAIEAEAQANAEELLDTVANSVAGWTGERPTTIMAKGEPITAILAVVAAEPSIHALVLGAASRGAPGPLVAYFAGERAGTLPCLVMIVPGGLDPERLEDLT